MNHVIRDPIRNDAELDQAITIIDELVDRSKRSAAEDDYLDVLGDLVHQYESEQHPIPRVSDGELLRFLIDMREVNQAFVARKTGIAESTISEVLSGRRKLKRRQIGKLAGFFQVAPGAFLDSE